MNNNRLRLSALLMVLFYVIFPERSLSESVVWLKNRVIDPTQEMAKDYQASDAEQHGDGLYIIMCTGLVQPAWVDALRVDGWEVLSYLPDNALIVRSTALTGKQIAKHSFMLWMGAYHAQDKLSKYLYMPSNKPSTTDNSPHPLVNVMTPKPGDVDAVKRFLKEKGVTVVEVSKGRTKGFLRAAIPDALYTALVERDDVEWVDAYHPPQWFNNVAVTSRLMNVSRVWNTFGLTGAGQIIGHADTGLDTGNTNTLMPDFAGRLIAAFALGRTNDWSDPNGHGTHTAGSIMGNGARSAGLFKGVAYEAGLVHQSLLTADDGLYLPVDLNDLFRPCYELGARLHSDSWGDTIRGYLLASYQIDEFVWNHPDMLPVFSAGNSGIDAERDGLVDPEQIGFLAEAKNTLVVGAAETWRTEKSTGDYSAYGIYFSSKFPVRPIGDDSMAWPFDGIHPGMAAFSSRGPCVDGRIKPDILAPGSSIISCRTQLADPPTEADVLGDISTMELATNYVFMDGTSMSCPLSAGAAALVREYYAEQEGWTNPSAALVKATLMGGAQSLFPGQYGSDYAAELPEARPNSIEGWGELNLEQALAVSNGLLRMFYDVPQTNGLNTGGQHDYEFVVSNTCALAVTLAWSDYPAQPEAARSLVNDLDLLLTAPDGTKYYPNRLTGPDRLNNVETVDIPGASTGTWTASISGYNIPTKAILGASQGYAVVIQSRPIIPLDTEVLTSGVFPNIVIPGVVPVIRAHTQGETADIDQVILRFCLNETVWQEGAMLEQEHGVFEKALVALSAGDRVDYQVRLYDATGGQHDGKTGFFHCRPLRYDVYPEQDQVPEDEGLTNNPYMSPLEKTVNYAPEGSELNVYDGDYVTMYGLFLGKSMVLRGQHYPPMANIKGTIFGPALIMQADATVEKIGIKGGMNSGPGGCVDLQAGTLRQCVVSDGISSERGGGIYASGNARVESCIICDCSAQIAGGGVYAADNAVFDHCIMTGNTADNSGGILAKDQVVLQHITITANSTTNGGAMDLQDSVSLLNSICYSNTTVLSGSNVFATTMTVSNACIEALTPQQMTAFYSITNNPQLNADGHLCAASPCIDYVAASVIADIDREYAWDDPSQSNRAGIADLGGDEWVDYDLDTQADYWEIRYFDHLQTSPTNDPDGDGLDNSYEYLLTTSPVNADSDSDQFSDGDEIIAGTNPLDSSSYLNLEFTNPNTGSTNVHLIWPSVSDHSYDILFRSNILTQVWQTLATNLPAIPPQNVYTVSTDYVQGYFAVRVK